MEREVGGGIGMGNTCKPMAVLFQFMTKFTTNKKKKKRKKKKNTWVVIMTKDFSSSSIGRFSHLILPDWSGVLTVAILLGTEDTY